MFGTFGLVLGLAGVSLCRADTIAVGTKVSITDSDAATLFRAMDSAKMQAKEDDIMVNIRATVECYRMKPSEPSTSTHGSTTPSAENFQCLIAQ